MTKGDQVIDYAAEVIQSVLDEHDITRKQLAQASGVSEASISRMFSGEQRVVVDLLAAAFRLTDDTRLLAVIRGDSPIDPHHPAMRPMRIPPVSQMLATVCKSVEKVAEGVPLMQRITADKRIDQSDGISVARFKAVGVRAIEHLHQAIVALDTHMARNGEPS